MPLLQGAISGSQELQDAHGLPLEALRSPLACGCLSLLLQNPGWGLQSKSRRFWNSPDKIFSLLMVSKPFPC